MAYLTLFGIKFYYRPIYFKTDAGSLFTGLRFLLSRRHWWLPVVGHGFLTGTCHTLNLQSLYLSACRALEMSHWFLCATGLSVHHRFDDLVCSRNLIWFHIFFFLQSTWLLSSRIFHMSFRYISLSGFRLQVPSPRVLLCKPLTLTLTHTSTRSHRHPFVQSHQITTQKRFDSQLRTAICRRSLLTYVHIDELGLPIQAPTFRSVWQRLDFWYSFSCHFPQKKHCQRSLRYILECVY